MAQKVVVLEKIHDVAEFDCGEPTLNTWLKMTAMQHQKNGTSKTFVLIDEVEPHRVLGFFSMAIRTMTKVEDLPQELQRKLPRQVSGFTLARLGVSVQMQGQKVGAFLLLEAMQRAYRASQNIGGFALFVDAKDGVAAFYEHFGFKPMPSDPYMLVMPMAAMPKFPDIAPN
jgi:GNAT superfamily N-acetyltransferase